ncbi:hypothetical protein EUX98_g6431 [Antrodiella citrinella]|uniref:GH16 domain-containing protein n=1 Tax=Antrodiella citrinella TaxID=2447956 RepID=A0A4S4MNZ9_9APHY|nr:hypothetical protein EUX98_g6431 [Antrodiella citrinella]
MANPPRRVPPPNQQYYAVPQSPRSAGPSRQPSQTQQQSYSTSNQPSNTSHSYMQQRNETAHGVATGHIGAGYGPYSYNPTQAAHYSSSRFSAAPSEVSAVTTGEKVGSTVPIASSNAVPPYAWDTKDPDLDDALHNPDPVRDAALDRSFTIFSARGWANVSVLVILGLGLLTLFAGYPVIIYVRDRQRSQHVGFNLGGTNATGQVPDLNMPSLIDKDTPTSAYTHVSTNGHTYNLVFSDEFETDGRTFYPGDDPYWEAVDLNYWPTGDIEWYDPVQISTANGKLVITMEEILNHNLNFRSGMLQSWNKLCFTTGYVEVSISLPGTPRAPGLWPGAWTMGNLGRAGYGATTEGMWPYSYASCDLGTFPNQQAKNGTPAAASTGGSNGGPLSFLPGQRLSACTCPNSDHPGPSVTDGRNVPEIDIIEAQVDVSTFTGEVSQSFQTAPYNFNYEFDNDSSATPIYDSSTTNFNSYKGGVYQQAISAVTTVDSNNYNNSGYAPYGYEWWSDPNNRGDGYITWFSNGQKTWTLTADTIGADPTSEISARIVPEEPMYIILNLGMSPSFQEQDFKHLTFPVSMYIDYVRVYQQAGLKDAIGCNPASHPTSDYINNHLNAYSNPNLTTWDSAGYSFPRNSLYDGC